MILEKMDLDTHSVSKADQLMVAVYMITYNHGAFIAQAIESVINQNTTFPYKLFIGEDCSIDNTRQICLEFKEKYPDKIELFLNEKNLGAAKNAQKIFSTCFQSGAKYISIIEGDDYWIDPFKLARQVEFLTKNDRYVLITDNAYLMENGEVNYWEPQVEKTFNQIDLIEYNCCATLTIMFRNIPGIRIPDYFVDFKIGDYPIYLFLLNFGLGFQSKRISGVHTLHEGGIYTRMSNVHRTLNEIYFFEKLYVEKALINRDRIKYKLQKLYYSLLCNKDFFDRKKSVLKIILNLDVKKLKSYVILIKSILKFIFYK